jgi:uncharacterized protein
MVASHRTGGTCAVAVMAKASIPGRTKTRLIPALGADQAANLNTALLRDVADRLNFVQGLTAIAPHMAYAPAGTEDFFRQILTADVGLLETVRPNFGDCLVFALEQLLARGYGSVCLVNSDSPTLPPAYLIAAVTMLAADGDRMVLGPAIDGGYYLIGLKAAHRRLFQDIDWSTERVFAQTMARAAELGLPVVVLPSWYDIDELPTLEILAAELFENRPFRHICERPVDPVHTRAVLTALKHLIPHSADATVRKIQLA